MKTARPSRKPLPILEFDPSPRAIIEPELLHKKIAIPEHAVLCFFQDVLEPLIKDGRAQKLASAESEGGRRIVYQLEYRGSSFAVGHLVLPTAAIRDEGTSYHYLSASREVEPDRAALAAVQDVLERDRIPYLLGKTWTTDAPFRETAGKIEMRRNEGCLTVEMEAAAFFAVARFRGVQLAQILYGGDDLTADGGWEPRGWSSHEVRERLLWLAAEACLAI